KRLIVGSLMFHLGIIPVFLGHVSGLGIPKTWTRALGISDELYHFGAVYGGGFFGIVTLIGMFILTTRRFSHRMVRMHSSKLDMIVYTLFFFFFFLVFFILFVT